METNKYAKDENYLKAKKKVESIKGFYWHLAVYMIINSIITIIKTTSNIGNGDSFSEALFSIGNFFQWVPWGIGLLIHGLVVFEVFKFLLGKNWEERKIKELMEKESKEMKEYK
jgi:hypothetical protein